MVSDPELIPRLYRSLPALHGFPLRAVVPGWEGAYAVKWLTHIQVIDKEHEGFFVKTAYRYPNRRVAPGEGRVVALRPCRKLCCRTGLSFAISFGT